MLLMVAAAEAVLCKDQRLKRYHSSLLIYKCFTWWWVEPFSSPWIETSGDSLILVVIEYFLPRAIEE